MMNRKKQIELNKYNEALLKIASGDKSGLKYLFDNYSASVGACVIRRTRNTKIVGNIIVAFYESIWGHTEEFRASQGDDITTLMCDKMKAFMDKRTCPRCGNLEDIYTINNLETPDMDEEQMKNFEREMEENKWCYGPDDKTYYCKSCDAYF
jgi:hypothetical protein